MCGVWLDMPVLFIRQHPHCSLHSSGFCLSYRLTLFTVLSWFYLVPCNYVVTHKENRQPEMVEKRFGNLDAPLYQQCGLTMLLADIGGWWRKTEIDNWRQRQRERGSLYFERISMLCLPVVSTFEEEAKEGKRLHYAF